MVFTTNFERLAPLVVEDQGAGFVPNPTGVKRASGLSLVRGLVRQLDGSLSIEQTDGARCTIVFRDRALH